MNEQLQPSSPEQSEMLAMLQKRMKGTFNDLLGMQVLAYHPGYCLCRLPIKPEFLNPIGSIHGGLLFTLADSTAGLASTDFSKLETVTTMQSDIQFVNPGLHLEEIYAEATCIKKGKRIVFTEVKVLTKEKQILCSGNFSFARIHQPNRQPM